MSRLYATASQMVDYHGLILLQGFHLLDLLAHFDRERIPERVVHAKGACEYEKFVVTYDITDFKQNSQTDLKDATTDILSSNQEIIHEGSSQRELRV
ncbi:catalase-domain-containing protein [Biscogniauxia marginata]|nr:catalase-domain-containing protein [Biscogniauxia marginata]